MNRLNCVNYTKETIVITFIKKLMVVLGVGFTTGVVIGLLFVSCVPKVYGDNWFVEVGAGYAPKATPWSEQMDDQRYSWKGSNPTAIIGVGREYDNGVTVQYQHISNWLTGWPVNGDKETSLDHISVSYKFRFGK